MNEYNMFADNLNAQDQMQRNAAEAQNKIYAPQLKDQLNEMQAAVIAQTNPAKALRVILEGFRGNIINEDGEIQKIGEPLLNDEGIARLASMLMPIINDPIRFGNIEKKEVRNITLQYIDDISEDIGLNWRSYGIKHTGIKNIIIDCLLALILITLTRSELQNEKNWLGRIVLENISVGKPLMQKKESLWEKYFKL